MAAVAMGMDAVRALGAPSPPPPPPPPAFITSAYLSRCPASFTSSLHLRGSKRSAASWCNLTASSMAEERQSGNGVDTRQDMDEDEDRRNWDVSNACINPVYRSSTLLRSPSESINDKLVRVLFLSEGNVCRSVYAEAIFTQLVRESGLSDIVECSSKATTNYNIGEPPDYRAVQVAEEYGLKLREGTVARVVDSANDIVDYDLLLVMDRFNASDLMKEVTLHEAIDKRTRYAYKVHRLGEFSSSRLIEDIDDPLYGNMGGPKEIELLRQVYDDLVDSCKGLIELLLRIKLTLQDTETLKQGLSWYLGQMDALEWFAPPMLQNKKSSSTY
ncbi:hypothetical protein O6H91_10G059900 [Diphasiastrum complanatum]|uniref:Uncharacterized protein n=2 Tax=Diphasiastrum complanatum TaxID=34168 RepID=A0ACC2CHL5_DIPCM|nr:hypothetical protein O6H91_10G059900 [Diphasiastrum complanatum]KAJ7541448.1 hypothetical protein O6H91_10G059900 [Diphasiastrum complanatum]